MKKITNYVFKKNNREIAVFYAGVKELKKLGIHQEDAILLKFDVQRSDGTEIFMHPDEALIVARLLIEGVEKTTLAYRLGVKK